MVVDLGNSKETKAGGSGVSGGAHPGIKVTQKDYLFVAGDVLDDDIQDGVEFVFGLRFFCQSENVGTDEGDWTVREPAVVHIPCRLTRQSSTRCS